MDPTAALTEIRRLVSLIQRDDDTNTNVVNELVYEFEALDDWLARGGFKPLDWDCGEERK